MDDSLLLVAVILLLATLVAPLVVDVALEPAQTYDIRANMSHVGMWTGGRQVLDLWRPPHCREGSVDASLVAPQMLRLLIPCQRPVSRAY